MITVDVMAHYFFGGILLVLATLAIIEATAKLQPKTTRLLFGGLVTLAGIGYNRFLYQDFNLTFQHYSTLSASNQQHAWIDIAVLIAGLLLLLTFRRPRLHLAVRTLAISAVAAVLLNHNQPHEFGHAAWLHPYHQIMASLLLVAAACYALMIKYERQLLPLLYMPIIIFSMVAGMLLSYHDPSPITSCTRERKVVEVKIGSDGFTPSTIQAQQCDTLRLVSTDIEPHEVAFGQHAEHGHYAGYSETILASGRTLDIDLVETGSFMLHDHLHDEMKASLVVQ